jgi:Zn-finger nucleic acid-binding protein
MRCPTCTPRSELVRTTLEPHLCAHACTRCAGQWVRPAYYWKWRALAAATPDPDGTAVHQTEVNDRLGLLYCPDCRYVLARCRVDARVPFTIDGCRNCEGVWLDADEWAALRAGEFHRHLHEIFTDEWQKRIREAADRERCEEQWQRQLGSADYRRIRHIKNWLDAHPKRSELYAYLGVHERVRTHAPTA